MFEISSGAFGDWAALGTFLDFRPLFWKHSSSPQEQGLLGSWVKVRNKLQFRKEAEAVKAVPLHCMNPFLTENVTVWRFSSWLEQIKAFRAFWEPRHHSMINKGKQCVIHFPPFLALNRKWRERTLAELLDVLGLHFPWNDQCRISLTASRNMFTQAFHLHTLWIWTVLWLNI